MLTSAHVISVMNADDYRTDLLVISTGNMCLSGNIAP